MIGSGMLSHWHARAQPAIGMYDNFPRYRIGQTKIISGSYAVDQHSNLVMPTTALITLR